MFKTLFHKMTTESKYRRTESYAEKMEYNKYYCRNIEELKAHKKVNKIRRKKSKYRRTESLGPESGGTSTTRSKYRRTERFY